jgi:hypothetical protein
MLPISAPERGGSVEALASFLNLPSRHDFVLIVAWLLAALRVRRPLSVADDIRRAGVSENCGLEAAQVPGRSQPVRAPAREERELMIVANNGYLLAFDNLFGLPFWLSDAFVGSPPVPALPCGGSTLTTKS